MTRLTHFYSFYSEQHRNEFKWTGWTYFESQALCQVSATAYTGIRVDSKISPVNCIDTRIPTSLCVPWCLFYPTPCPLLFLATHHACGPTEPGEMNKKIDQTYISLLCPVGLYKRQKDVMEGVSGNRTINRLYELLLSFTPLTAECRPAMLNK